MEILATFKIIFLGIVLEALPFILLGSLVSSLIHQFVSEESIKKCLPKHKILGIVMASMMGIVFPICECAIVPIVRRLLKKGVPLYIAITFMISVPIINPIVLFSTFVAFKGFPEIVMLRAFMGLAVAWIVGAILSLLEIENKEVLLPWSSDAPVCGCHDGALPVSQLTTKMPRRQNPIHDVLYHTSVEFYEIGKLLIIGALISAIFKSVIPRDFLMTFGENNSLAIMAMMGFAFILSLCSEVDAFVARSFTGIFSTGSVMAFLVLGPMIDIKNYMILRATFKRSFVLFLTGLLFLLVFVMSFVSSIG